MVVARFLPDTAVTDGDRDDRSIDGGLDRHRSFRDSVRVLHRVRVGLGGRDHELERHLPTDPVLGEPATDGPPGRRDGLGKRRAIETQAPTDERDRPHREQRDIIGGTFVEQCGHEMIAH